MKKIEEGCVFVPARYYYEIAAFPLFVQKYNFLQLGLSGPINQHVRFKICKTIPKARPDVFESNDCTLKTRVINSAIKTTPSQTTKHLVSLRLDTCFFCRKQQFSSRRAETQTDSITYRWSAWAPLLEGTETSENARKIC